MLYIKKVWPLTCFPFVSLPCRTDYHQIYCGSAYPSLYNPWPCTGGGSVDITEHQSSRFLINHIDPCIYLSFPRCPAEQAGVPVQRSV